MSTMSELDGTLQELQDRIEVLEERITLLEATLERALFALGQVAIADEFRDAQAKVNFWAGMD